MLGISRSARFARGTMLSRPSRLTSGIAAAVLSLAVLPILAVDAQADPTPPPLCDSTLYSDSAECVVPDGVTSMFALVAGAGGGGALGFSAVGRTSRRHQFGTQFLDGTAIDHRLTDPAVTAARPDRDEDQSEPEGRQQPTAGRCHRNVCGVDRSLTS